MRALIVIVVVVAALFLIGWLSFSRDGDGASMTIETEAIKEDTSTMVDSAKDMLETTEQQLEESDAEPIEVEVQQNNEVAQPAP